MSGEDPHHCNCFSISPNDCKDFREKLENLGFADEIQENHGQIFGRVLRIADDLQLHIKVMPNGRIEAEMEPPPAYPFAHLNPEHSYSAHNELGEIFKEITIQYKKKTFSPLTCLRRKIKKPKNPTHAKTIVAVGIGALALGALVYYLSKDEEDRL